MRHVSKKIKKTIRIIICPCCGTPQKLGSDCGICAAPLYKPYLIEQNKKLVLRTHKELRLLKELKDATNQEETSQKGN